MPLLFLNFLHAPLTHSSCHTVAAEPAVAFRLHISFLRSMMQAAAAAVTSEAVKMTK